jgi:hypothetical protein
LKKVIPQVLFCHKNIVSLWQNQKCMANNSSYKEMEVVVENSDKGAILFPDDFTICGTPDAVRSGLSRLCQNGKLHRFANQTQPPQSLPNCIRLATD